MTRLELLERVNELNLRSFAKGDKTKFWTCICLYNTVIWSLNPGETPVMFEVIEGVPK